ncbi:MAG TPA: FAD-linked oxidase C-terminal domain-containing protein [Gemmatimonadales bacterium]|nr:FAD-linked oxidase C-terminal domain-containing protein [Gemmatimonadales bacterium]
MRTSHARGVGEEELMASDATLRVLPGEGLVDELEHTIEGEVRFDRGSRALYATDLSVYRQVPIGVVIPRNLNDVIRTVAACRRRGVPILSRGCGTSLSGQCCNVAVVIDFSKYLHRVVELDPERGAWVEPGVICDQLIQAAEPNGLTLAPDPATHKYCTLGGMIGNNSCGAHSVMGGKTVDNVEELEILTYDGLRLRVGKTDDAELERIIRAGGRRGEIYQRMRALRDRYADQIRARFPRIPRRVSGYNLDELLPENGFHVARALVGSESTLVVVLGARMRLVPSPPCRALLVIGYAEPWLAADRVPEILETGPIALEAFTRHVIDNMIRKGKPHAGARLLPEGNTWLLVEFGGSTSADAVGRAREAMAKIEAAGDHREMRLLEDRAEQNLVWHIREAGVGASRVPGVENAWPSWEDSAVAPEKLGAYLRDFIKLLDRYHYRYTLFGHFGQGCVHMRFAYDTKTVEGVKRYRAFMEDAADLVVRYGGSLSGEHGDGQAKGELLPKMFGAELMEAFREFKRIWDPEWKMNPGKVIDAYPLDSNLRLGPDYHPRVVNTHFKFPDDHGSMSQATERCFGVGLCRRLDAGTMCPSFKATREEMHTTRGRAHLLFEMLRGEVLPDGWRDEHVKEALDLCLACKGCKSDCPVSVDIATYKAEFLSHYYDGRLRPLRAYALGLVSEWSRLAARAPGLANLLTQTPALAQPVKALLGLAPERRLPPFAPGTFQAWFRRRRPRNADGPRVVLWPDTFNNHFHPETAEAAVEVLEAAGHRVLVPAGTVCCGRPLYDYGMLDRAARRLDHMLATLRPMIRAGVPVVCLEPSCAAVFRDELLGIRPNDEDAKRLSAQTFLLGEFLARSDDFKSPRLAGKAIVHAHCHQKAISDADADQKILRALGLEVDVLDAGCCGLAGSFGYERDHYEVSMRAGEHVLLPAVRHAARSTIIVADGFSCRTQIAHATERRALHLGQVIQMAMREGRWPEQRAPASTRRAALGALTVGGVLAGGAGWVARNRRRRHARAG